MERSVQGPIRVVALNMVPVAKQDLIAAGNDDIFNRLVAIRRGCEVAGKALDMESVIVSAVGFQPDHPLSAGVIEFCGSADEDDLAIALNRNVIHRSAATSGIKELVF